jgi:hypothetical protein
MILAFTGFHAALAAETVSLCICIKVPFFDFRSVVVGFNVVVGGGNVAGDGVVDGADVEDGSELMRSISVVPEESAMDIGQIKVFATPRDLGLILFSTLLLL